MTSQNPPLDPDDPLQRGLARFAPWLFAGLLAGLVLAGLGAVLHIVGRVREHEQLEHLWTEAIWLAAVDVLALLLAAALSHAMLKRRAGRRNATLREQMRGWQVLEAIANCSTDAIYAKDLQGRYIFANREACRMLGRSREQMLSSSISDVAPPEQAPELIEVDRQVLRNCATVTGETQFRTVDGDRTFHSTKGPLLDGSGRLLGVFGVSRDITERKREEDRWRQWAMAFEHMRDGVMITDTLNRIQAVNRSFSVITGYSAEEAVGATPRLLHSGRQGPEFYRRMWAQLDETGSWHGEIWNRRKSGEVYPEWLTLSAIRDEQGELTHYVGVFTDISGIRSAEVEIDRLARYDRLTGLPNRAQAQEQLTEALARGERQGTRTAALVIDLDGFKTINDSLGHPAGDELLVCVAQRLRECLHGELLGRLGGDEFLVISEGVDDPAAVAQLARELLAAIAEPMQLACGREAYLTASIGICMLHPDDGVQGAMELLRDADAALYCAKELGRNRFSFYTCNMNAEALVKLELEAALSRALGRGELLLHYQPKIELASGRVVGAEALLRWHRKDHGLVPPGRFIPVAEQSSLILEIGAWVIDQACRQLRLWRENGQPVVRLAVNVAARQFAAGDLDLVVSQALSRHGVPAELLEVELTEGMLVTEPQAAIAMMGRLKQLGVKLSLDDFGTGYSSLAYLQRFPIDALKIDQSFVRDIGRGPDGAALVDAIITLAHRLDLRVVAEGVETAAQRDYLMSRGCDEVQGYFFGRPAPADTLQALLEAPALAA